MVCLAQELRCECIIRDSAKNLRKFEVTLPASTSVHELVSQVAENMQYEPSSIQLTWQNDGSEVSSLYLISVNISNQITKIVFHQIYPKGLILQD